MIGALDMGWFWIWPVLVVIGVVVLGYLAYRLTPNRRPGPDSGAIARTSSARRNLDERYARGEIDERDYQRRRADLR